MIEFDRWVEGARDGAKSYPFREENQLVSLDCSEVWGVSKFAAHIQMRLRSEFTPRKRTGPSRLMPNDPAGGLEIVHTRSRWHLRRKRVYRRLLVRFEGRFVGFLTGSRDLLRG
jgi:hypothetical protein